MRLSELLTKYETEYVPTIIDQRRFKCCIGRLMALDAEISDLNYQTLLNYRARRVSEGVSESTCNKELSVLGSALRWGNRCGHINVRVYIPRTKETPRPHAMDEHQIQRMIDKSDNLKCKAYIALLFLTGQRKDSLIKLRASQVVNEVILFADDGYEMAHRRKKRANIPVTAEIRSILDALRNAYGETEYVIPGSNGKGYCRELDRGFASAASRAGLQGMTAHVLRHSACSVALQKGRSMQEVSNLLGHSSIGITQKVYAHFKPGYLSDTVNALGGSIRL